MFVKIVHCPELIVKIKYGMDYLMIIENPILNMFDMVEDALLQAGNRYANSSLQIYNWVLAWSKGTGVDCTTVSHRNNLGEW